MNTHDHTSTKSVRPAGLIGAILAIALIIGAGVIQGDAKPAGTAEINVPVITQADHIRGELTAPVQVIEYSDLECPFCKDFHATMNQIFEKYGTEGKIAWAYRHFPLTALHQQATDEAIATECVAKLAGPEAFWTMTDSIFVATKSNDGLDLSTLPALAKSAGVTDAKAFANCYAKKETAAIVAEHVTGGTEAGAQGTPYTVVISPAGSKFVISGAYGYNEVSAIIEKALNDK